MTARTPQEVIRDGVRAQVQELLTHAGVDQGRVATEVLFWLPVKFVEGYEALFMAALHLGDGDDRAKAGADEGQVKAKVPSSLRGTQRNGGGLAAQGGGKRYKTEWVVKDEAALAAKARLDRGLMKLIEEAQRSMRNAELDRKIAREQSGSGSGRGENAGIEMREVGVSQGGRGGKKVMEVSQGSTPGSVIWKFVDGERTSGRCNDCGKIMSRDWTRCPFHDA